MGLVGTTVALALGLLVGSAKGSFDTKNTEIAQLAANSVLHDRLLAHHRPEANDAHNELRVAVSGFNRLTLSQNRGVETTSSTAQGEPLLDAIQVLSPHTDNQRSTKSQALSLAIQIGQTRWLMLTQRAVPVPVILLSVLVFWLVTLFVSFGVFAKPNGTLITGLFVFACAVSAAIFLIVEIYHPYTGLIQFRMSPFALRLPSLDKVNKSSR
jgi:hypothetical protein